MSDHVHQFPEEETPEGVRLLLPCLLCGLPAGDAMKQAEQENADLEAVLSRQRICPCGAIEGETHREGCNLRRLVEENARLRAALEDAETSVSMALEMVACDPMAELKDIADRARAALRGERGTE